MSAITPIIKTTIRESIRKKQLYVLILLSIFVLILVSMASFFEMKDQIRFIKNISIFIIPIIGIIVSTFATARQLPMEIESRTIHPLLVKPISRWEYLLGKYLGVLSISWISMLTITIIFSAFIFLKNIPVNIVFLHCIILFFLQIAIYSAMVLFFSIIVSHAANVMLSFLLYIFLHSFGGWMEAFIHDTDSPAFKLIYKVLFWIPPHLDYFNLSFAVIYDHEPASSLILIPFTAYAFGYITIFIILAGLVFRNKEL